MKAALTAEERVFWKKRITGAGTLYALIADLRLLQSNTKEPRTERLQHARWLSSGITAR